MRRHRPRKRAGAGARAALLQGAMLGLPLVAALVYLLWVPWVAVIPLGAWGLLAWVDRSLKGR